MEASLEYLQTLVGNNDEAILTEYLDFVTETKLFCLNRSKREDSSLINNLLSSKETVPEGLVVLANYIGQCPREILSANILSWIQQAAKNLINPENGSLSHIAFKVLGTLLDLSSNFPDARKQVALNIIPKVLDHFVRESKGNREDILILHCLEQTIKTFGKSCGFHKEALSKLIFQHLDSSPSCVYIAGKCYLALAICGGPGVDSENYINSWQNQQKFLLNSLHGLLDHLFENISEANDNHKKYKLQGSHPVVPKINEKSLIKRNQNLAKQFIGLGEFFRILLLGSFPVRKRILPEAILGLVWRGLSINYHTLTVGKQSIDTSSLVTIISKVNFACLEILEALIISCSLNLISYSQLICRILTQALKWTETENWPFGITKPHCLLRVKVYECLWKWLNVSRSCSGVENYLDDLISTVITDINHDPPAVSLKVPTGKGKKRIREMRTMKTVEASLEYLINPQMNSESCEASLKFVSSLLNSTSTQMKAEHHKELQRAIVSKLISIQQGKFPLPYSIPKCRLALYEALLCLCQNCHHNFQPPVSYATVIFSQGIKDTSIEVSRFCLFSLRNIEKILRPICPALDFPSTDGGIERLNITVTHDNEEETFLLNESSRSIKRKRKSQQLTSTPLTSNVSRQKLLSPGIGSPLHSSFQNLSDFERGANADVVDNVTECSFTQQSHTEDRSSPTTHHIHDAENEDLPDESHVNSEEIVNGNEDSVEVTDSQSPLSKTRDGKSECEQVDSFQIKSQELNKNKLKSSSQTNTPRVQEEIQNEDEVIDVHSGDSDNEMISSFVDEIIVDD